MVRWATVRDWRERLGYCRCDSPVETVMMLSFAALVLRGRARDGSLAAIMVTPA